MTFFQNCLKGIAIGSGAILPGISSGVFCVIFGIYEKLLDSILNFKSDIKNNIKFLVPILIGVVFGFFIFGNVLSYCLYKFPIQSKSIFIGLILGSIPRLFKEVHKKEKFKFFYLIYFFVSLSIGIGSIFLEKFFSLGNLQNINVFYLVLCGFCMSIGIIVPGVSSTIILMLLGIYGVYLNSVSTLFLPVLFPLGCGVLLGSFCFMKLTKFLLDNFYVSTFYAIIGFTVGSIFVLCPAFSSILDIIISVLCILFRFLYIFFFVIASSQG